VNGGAEFGGYKDLKKQEGAKEVKRGKSDTIRGRPSR